MGRNGFFKANAGQKCVFERILHLVKPYRFNIQIEDILYHT